MIITEVCYEYHKPNHKAYTVVQIKEIFFTVVWLVRNRTLNSLSRKHVHLNRVLDNDSYK